jgi:hypothetical protein
MPVNYDADYSRVAPSGIARFLTTVQNQNTYRLVTGVSRLEPFRGSAAGRACDSEYFHFYTTDQLCISSGEVLGTGTPPPGSLIGIYQLSGEFLDYDKIQDPDFQQAWGQRSGEQRHEYSQGFTRFLIDSGHMPPNVVGSVWTSCSGQILGHQGRCFCVMTHEPNVRFIGEVPYPQT